MENKVGKWLIYYTTSVVFNIIFTLKELYMEQKFEMGPLQKLWVKTLREHPERQYKGYLGYKNEKEEKYCCLGQLHVLAKGEAAFYSNNNVSDGVGLMVLNYSFSKYGLVSETGGIIDSLSNSLANMNDGDYTWPEIADFIEQNPEKVFTKAV